MSEQERAELAAELLDGLADGRHYSPLAYDDDNRPISVVWNFEYDPDKPYQSDHFNNRELSEECRKLAIEHQEQFDELDPTCDDCGTPLEVRPDVPGVRTRWYACIECELGDA